MKIHTALILALLTGGALAQGPLKGTTLNLSGNATVGGSVTATSGFVGNVTGNVSGSAGSASGNAATATALQTSRNIAGTAFNGTANINIDAFNLSGTSLATTVVDSNLESFGQLVLGIEFASDNAVDIGASATTFRPRTVYAGTSVISPLFQTAAGIYWTSGTGTPEGSVTANVGALYSRNNGSTGTTLYVKETGTGNTGWAPAGAAGAAAAGSLTGTTLAANVVTSSLETFGTLGGHLIFTDNTYDIGASGATRPRTGYFGTSIVTPLVTATTLTGAAGGVTLDASGFDGNLATSDNTLQEIAQKLDDLAAGGSVATDALFDAKGDLPVGTGANTAAKLTVGSNGQYVVADSAEATGLKWITAPTLATDALWDAAGDLAVGSGANTSTKLSMGTALQVLRVNSGATNLEWATAGTGDVVGPSSATDNAVTLFDSTTGKLIKNSTLVFASSRLQMGGLSATPATHILTGQEGTGSNINAGVLQITGPRGTGTGSAGTANGAIEFLTPTSGASSSTAHTLTSHWRINGGSAGSFVSTNGSSTSQQIVGCAGAAGTPAISTNGGSGIYDIAGGGMGLSVGGNLKWQFVLGSLLSQTDGSNYIGRDVGAGTYNRPDEIYAKTLLSAPKLQALKATSGSNTAATDTSVRGGLGTGTGTTSAVTIYTSDTVGSGGTQQTESVRLTVATTKITGTVPYVGSVSAPAALAAAATTFAVTADVMDITGDAGGNTVATITGGTNGQVLILYFVDALITITDTGAATADTVNLSAAFTSTADDTITLVRRGGKWFETARSVN